MDRHRVEKDEYWLEWTRDLPYIDFPNSWKVKVVPPFAGALIRFVVCKEGDPAPDKFVSVYLDVENSLGICRDEEGNPKPYWEIYPDVQGTNVRFFLDEVDDMIEAIEQSLNNHKTEHVMSNDNQITDIDEFYELLQEVENGERKPFEAYVQLKAMESELKSLKSKFKGHVTEALMDYPDGDAPQALGHEITLRSRTKYKYKQCPQYQNIEDKRKALKEQIKMATEQNVSIADEETGEMIEPVEKTETTYPVVNQIKEES